VSANLRVTQADLHGGHVRWVIRTRNQNPSQYLGIDLRLAHNIRAVLVSGEVGGAVVLTAPTRWKRAHSRRTCWRIYHEGKAMELGASRFRVTSGSDGPPRSNCRSLPCIGTSASIDMSR
jgi:hypothetical protein